MLSTMLSINVIHNGFIVVGNIVGNVVGNVWAMMIFNASALALALALALAFALAMAAAFFDGCGTGSTVYKALDTLSKFLVSHRRNEKLIRVTWG